MNFYNPIFSYFLVWVITKISNLFCNGFFLNRIKVITKFKKNFKNFNTVFLIDSCKIDSLVPIFQANRLSMIWFRIGPFRRIEHPYYIVNIVTWKTVQYWKTNSSLLKNNSSLLKHFWYKKKSLLYCQYCNKKNYTV